MEDILINIFYILIFLITLKLLFFRKRVKNPPPSPPSLPIIGNLHQLKPPIHRTLHALSQKYGPIFSLRFGSQPVLVVSSASAAEECFTKNDIVFANLFHSTTTKYLTFNNTIITISSYGDHWRNLRRIISLEILSNHRLNSFIGLRKDETLKLLRKLAKDSNKDFKKVELRSMFSELTFNIVMRMVCGKRYYGEDNEGTNVEEAKKFREVMNEISQFGLGSKSNLGDFVAFFRWFDFSGHDKKLRKLGEKIDALFQGLVDEHRNKKEKSNTMIDHLLSSQESQPEYYTDQIIKGLIMKKTEKPNAKSTFSSDHRQPPPSETATSPILARTLTETRSNFLSPVRFPTGSRRFIRVRRRRMLHQKRHRFREPVPQLQDQVPRLQLHDSFICIVRRSLAQLATHNLPRNPLHSPS